jgi:hypothetical protein
MNQLVHCLDIILLCVPAHCSAKTPSHRIREQLSALDMPKINLDYSLYLVTGRELLPSGKVCGDCPLRLQSADHFAGLLRVSRGGRLLFDHDC